MSQKIVGHFGNHQQAGLRIAGRVRSSTQSAKAVKNALGHLPPSEAKRVQLALKGKISPEGLPADLKCLLANAIEADFQELDTPSVSENQ